MGREKGGRFKRAGIFVYLWVIHVRFGRKQQNSVKQLSFNKKIKFKIWGKKRMRTTKLVEENIDRTLTDIVVALFSWISLLRQQK